MPAPKGEIRHQTNKCKSQAQWTLKRDFVFINEATGSQLADVEMHGQEI